MCHAEVSGIYYVSESLKTIYEKYAGLLPDKESAVWGNIIYSILLSTILILTEQCFRIFTDGLLVNISFRNSAETFLFFLIISFVGNPWIRNSVIAFYLSFSLLQMFHFSYFGSWIYPIEILLFFQKSGEMLATFFSVFYLFYMPVILTIVALILVITLLRVPIPRKSSIVASLLLAILIAASLIKPPRATARRSGSKQASA